MHQPELSTKTVSVKLDSETRSRIENIAQARQRTAHWVMREAIYQYLDREEKRNAFRQDTMNAWEEYQETGLHANAAEVETWLTSWGSENELSAPPMSQIIYSAAAVRDLQRLQDFLRKKNPAAAKRAAEAIVKAIQVLVQQPQIGRPVEDLPIMYREWLIADRLYIQIP